MILNLLLLVSGSIATNPLIAAYWGLGSGTDTEGLMGVHCMRGSADTILLEHAKFNSTTGISMRGHCYVDEFDSWNYCRQLERDIFNCQREGKRVYLAMSGEVPWKNTAFGTYSEVARVLDVHAKNLVDMFTPTSATKIHPFGKARVNGLYFDHIMTQEPYIVEFAKAIKRIAPDMIIGFESECGSQNFELIDKHFDFSVIRFFLSELKCNIDQDFNWKETSAAMNNKNVAYRAYVGIQGAPGEHYIDANAIKQKLPALLGDDNFAGFAISGAASAEDNHDFTAKIRQELPAAPPSAQPQQGSSDNNESKGTTPESNVSSDPKKSCNCQCTSKTLENNFDSNKASSQGRRPLEIMPEIDVSSDLNELASENTDPWENFP